MIDKFGQVMLYVNDVKNCADFWENKLSFTKVDEMIIDGKLISVEFMPYNNADTNLVLFDKEFVKATSGLAHLATPSLLFSTYDIKKTHKEFKDNGVNVSDISDIQGLINFNFPDPENNYFAVREINK